LQKKILSISLETEYERMIESGLLTVALDLGESHSFSHPLFQLELAVLSGLCERMSETQYIRDLFYCKITHVPADCDDVVYTPGEVEEQWFSPIDIQAKADFVERGIRDGLALASKDFFWSLIPRDLWGSLARVSSRPPGEILKSNGFKCRDSRKTALLNHVCPLNHEGLMHSSVSSAFVSTGLAPMLFAFQQVKHLSDNFWIYVVNPAKGKRTIVLEALLEKHSKLKGGAAFAERDVENISRAILAGFNELEIVIDQKIDLPEIIGVVGFKKVEGSKYEVTRFQYMPVQIKAKL
jgi:hypothetical protein